MTSLDAIDAAARHHFAASVQHQIDFLFALVMVGEVGPVGVEMSEFFRRYS